MDLINLKLTSVAEVTLLCWDIHLCVILIKHDIKLNQRVQNLYGGLVFYEYVIRGTAFLNMK